MSIAALLRGACIFLVALCSFPAAGICEQNPVTTEVIKQRGIVSGGDSRRLLAVMEKARNGGEITVAAIGGSITAGGLQTKDPANRYIARVAAWFTKTFPNAKVRFINAGIGGTNSVYGAMRIKGDVLSKKPDLVIVEFAVNDKANPIFPLSYEGVLRQILREPQKPALIQLFFMHAGGIGEQVPQQKIGEYYSLPMVSFRDAWWPEINEGRVKWDDLYADVVHPNDKGHILASELLISVLEEVNRKLQPGTAAPTIASELPAPLSSEVFAHCRFTQYADLKPTATCNWVNSPDKKKWESAASDGSITFGFTGKVLFVGYDIDKGAESLATFSIDGGAPQPLKTDGNRLPLATDLTPGEHNVCIAFAGSKLPQGATDRMRIWGVGAAGGQ